MILRVKDYLLISIRRLVQCNRKGQKSNKNQNSLFNIQARGTRGRIILFLITKLHACFTKLICINFFGTIIF